MLVLNRRPGESIIIEPDFHVTVLSVTDRRVWIGIRSSGTVPSLRVSATVVSASEARLEIGPLSSVTFDLDTVRVATAPEAHPGHSSQAGLAINRKLGQHVEVGSDLWISVASVSKGNPCISFGGPAVGEEFSVTLIRPSGNYVRLGVDAPSRRVYREELWEAVQSSGDRLPAIGSLADGATLEGVDLRPLRITPAVPASGQPSGGDFGAEGTSTPSGARAGSTGPQG